MNKDNVLLLEMVANRSGGDLDKVKQVIQSAVIEVAGFEADSRIELDTGTNQFRRYWDVVSDEKQKAVVEPNNVNQLPLSEAVKKDPTAKVGETVSEEIHLSRIALQKLKRLFSMEMRNAERSRLAESYRGHVGEVLVATVQRQQFSRDSIILSLNEEVELLLSHDHMIPKEEIRVGDRLYVYLYEIDTNAKGPQLLVSRTAPELLAGLFKRKILEVDSGVIEVKSVARDPGLRAKVAVKTNDGRINPIGTCIGRSGERIQAISTELNDEHIDIILWDDNPAQLAIHALTPAEVVSITMDEDTRVMDIAVRSEDVPRAIGRNGQNTRLASQLTGWTINIMSAAEAEKKNTEASDQLATLLRDQLNIEAGQAAELVSSGFANLEDITYASNEELRSALALTEEQIEHLRDRANDLLLAEAFAQELETAPVDEANDESLDGLSGMTPELLKALTAHGIDSRESLAELSIDDLLEIAPLTRQSAGQLIMGARTHWFKQAEEA